MLSFELNRFLQIKLGVLFAIFQVHIFKYPMKKLSLFLCLICTTLLAQERKIVINECMPNNTNTTADQDGEYNDWVELYNISSAPANLEGYFLSDRRSAPTKFRFPNVSIAPNDYLIVWTDKDSLQAGLHTNFKLSASSEQVYLFNPDTNLIDYVHFYNMQPDESIARTEDGNGPFKVTSSSYNTTNNQLTTGLVINEWMAWNESENMDEYGEYNDWIELYNNSSSNINLEGYFISNKANEATKYQFPNITIGANEYLILWADEDTLQGELHLPFKLDSERDDIILSRPDTSTIDYFFHHNVDSNLTQARIPNGIGNINTGVSTPASSNELFVNIDENEFINLSVYPNPFSEYLLIDKHTYNEDVSIYDAKGSLIYTDQIKTKNTRINTSSFKSGIYYIGSSNNKLIPLIKTKVND